jgi:alpha(1,3/1,4) fucosyltransferase
MKKLNLFIFLINFINISPKEKPTIYFTKGSFGALFDLKNKIINRDDVRRPLYNLKQALQNLNFEVKEVASIANLHNPYKIICFDIPLKEINLIKQYPSEKCVLFLWEPPSTKPYNYETKYHNHFSKVFTLIDSLVDNIKYFKFFEPQPDLVFKKNLPLFNERKFVVMLGSYRSSKHPKELYSERIKLAEFFENKKEQFELYGLHWPKHFKNYKGFTESKIECYKDFKFTFCYENMQEIEGYITGQKIFYPMLCGCIPIYWGASNVEKYIPTNCFIDRRKFKTNEEMYNFLKNIQEDEYNTYVENIRNFLTSKEASLFSSDFFVSNFIKGVLN